MRRPYRALLLHAMRPVPRVPRAQGKIRRGRRPLQAVLRELLTEKRMPRHLSPDEPRLPRFPLNRLRSTRFVRADLAAAPPVMETEAVTVDEGDRPGKKRRGGRRLRTAGRARTACMDHGGERARRGTGVRTEYWGRWLWVSDATAAWLCFVC